MKLKDSLIALIVLGICLAWAIIDGGAASQGIGSALRLMTPLDRKSVV